MKNKLSIVKSNKNLVILVKKMFFHYFFCNG